MRTCPSRMSPPDRGATTMSANRFGSKISMFISRQQPNCGRPVLFSDAFRDRALTGAPQRRYGKAVGRTATLDAVFAALADPTRRQILAMLLEDDMAVTDVAEPFEMSLAAISKHLAILTRARLISQEKRGRVKWCKLEPDAMRDASLWMQSFGQFDRLDFDAFERFLDTELEPASGKPDGDDG